MFSEPFVARKQGGDPKTLMVSELGFNPYTSLLFTREKTIDASSDLVRRFTIASLRGWKTYLESAERTNRRINKLNPAMDLDILQFGADSMKDLCLPDGMPVAELGRMTSERWQTLSDQLIEVGALDAENEKTDAAWTDRFLKQDQPSP